MVLYEWVEWLKEEHSHLFEVQQQQQQQQQQQDALQECKVSVFRYVYV